MEHPTANGTPAQNPANPAPQPSLSTAEDIIGAQQQQIQQLCNALLNHVILGNENHSGRTQSTSGIPVLRREYIDMIPAFRGEASEMAQFLKIIDTLHDQFYDNQNPHALQNFLLISSIRGKILPPAAQQIAASNPQTFEEIRQAIVSSYADKRDDLTLILELANLRQVEGEDAFKFLEKVQTTLQTLVAYSSANDGPDESGTLIAQYLKLGLRIFLLHVREPLGSVLRTRQPADLNEALGMMTNEYQLLSSSKKIYAQSSGQTKTPNNQPRQFANNQPRQFTNNYTNNQPRQYSNNYGNNVRPNAQNPRNQNFHNQKQQQYSQQQPRSNVQTYNRPQGQNITQPNQNFRPQGQNNFQPQQSQRNFSQNNFAPRNNTQFTTNSPSHMSWKTTNLHNLDDQENPSEPQNAVDENQWSLTDETGYGETQDDPGNNYPEMNSQDDQQSDYFLDPTSLNLQNPPNST